MSARALTAMLIVAAAGQASPAPAARAVVRYSVSSEDDSSNAGRLVVPVRSSDLEDAVIWEAGCRVSASADPSALPAAADQSWRLRFDLARGRDNRPAIRVRLRHLTARGASAEDTRVLVVDAAESLSVNELSAHTDCRYDRIHITVSAEAMRPPLAARPSRD